MKEDEDVEKVMRSMTLEKLEATLLTKVQEIQDKMQHTENPEEMQKLGITLSGLLDNIERTRKAKKV